jgi:GNAT superfamily N-acetyltransferase
MLRLATKEDRGEVLRMARAFHKASPYSGITFSEDVCSALFDQYILGDKTGLIIILSVDKDPYGMVIGHCATPPFSTEKVASEIAWWVDEDHRGSRDSVLLLKAYEDWALRVGASMCQVAMLDDVTDLQRFYQRQGYRPAERSFVKEL